MSFYDGSNSEPYTRSSENKDYIFSDSQKCGKFGFIDVRLGDKGHF